MHSCERSHYFLKGEDDAQLQKNKSLLELLYTGMYVLGDNLFFQVDRLDDGAENI